jgi:hypothetical protein
MERIEYQFIVEATSPIAHHSGVEGNHAELMRKKVAQGRGEFAWVPYVTGDTMRHGIREAAAYAALDAAGLLGKIRLTEAAVRLLFSGGMLGGLGDSKVANVDDYRRMCAAFPPLALLGGCAGNRCIPGRLEVGHATLICAESERIIPAWAKAYVDGTDAEVPDLSSAREHVEIHQRVRMDALLSPDIQRLLPDAQSVFDVDAEPKAKKRGKGGDGEGKSTMLPRTYETIIEGSLLYWPVVATVYNDLDLDTLHTAVFGFLAQAKVGGKRGTGCGGLRVVSARKVVHASAAARATGLAVVDEVGLRVGELFRKHMADVSAEFASFLTTVSA